MKIILTILAFLAVTGPAQAQPTTHQKADVILGIGSLSMASIATGLTTSCIASNDCRELNPVMAKLLKDGPVSMTVTKAVIGGVTHYAVWRLFDGKTRTALLAAMFAINAWDAVHDIRVMRQIQDRKAPGISFSFSMPIP